MLLDDKLRRLLIKVYGSSFPLLLSKLAEPSKKMYIRVNTCLISRDELIERLVLKGLNAKPEPMVEEAIYIELEGPYEVPLHGKKVYVDKYAAESIAIGANLYAPGIQSFDEFRDGDLLVAIAPNGEPVALLKAIVSSERLRGMRRGLVAITLVSKYRAPPIRELPEYREGLIYPQSLPAMIVSKIAAPKPGELIVDMNAAPGGKTSHLVQLSKGSSRIIALERSVGKSNILVSTLMRLRLYKNVVVLPLDSRYIDRDLNLVNRADKVIVDPPCTALGVRPKVLVEKAYKDVINLSRYQLQFLKTATKIVKPGGLIIYSTCTLTLEENEYNTLTAIEKYGLEPVDLGILPYSEKVKYKGVIAYRFSPLSHDMPGYYIAVLRKP